jgi:tetratricopeptide (TPR) repeat protein
MHARGHYLFLRTAHGGVADDLFQCRKYFEAALDLDPTFAPAVAGLANFYAVAARRGMLIPFHEHFARAIELSRKALEMDPTLAVPHVHFAVEALYLDDDFARAGVEFATAVAKDPGYAEGHRFYGVWLGLAGRHAEALLAMEQAVALEPDISHFLSSLGAAHLAVGNRTDGEAALRRTLRIEPTHAAARNRLIRLLEDDGRYDEAIEERERPPALPDAARYREAFRVGAEAYRALRDAALRREAEALEARILEGGEPTPNDLFSPPFVRIVQLYAMLGDRKRARSWQAHATAVRPGLARWFEFLPELRR